MQLSNAPAKVVLPFANAGLKNTIPVPDSATPGAASFTAGFPPETMMAVTSGGVPPSGKDFNGILFDATSVDRWFSAGASFPFDATFATAIGGYPVGARVLPADGNGFWQCTADNNSNNPETGGGGWVRVGAVAIGSVYASAQTSSASGIQKVAFNSVEFDSRSMWDAGNARFKAIYAGQYRFSGSVFLKNPSSQELATMVYKNGSIAKQCFSFPQLSDVDLTLPFEAVVNLAVNDYVDLYLYASQASVNIGLSSGSNQPFVYAQFEYLGQ